MDLHEFFGKLSGSLVLVSVIPYAIQTWRGKVKPNITSWGLWALIGICLLLTYDSSGAKESIWPAVFGAMNPIIITSLAVWKGGQSKKFNNAEKACVAISLSALGLWWFVRGNPSNAQYALYLALVADGIAAIPAIKTVWDRPEDDRPFAWVMFSMGYGLAFFAISEPTVANYALPSYMFLAGNLIAIPLIRYRLRYQTPLREWV